MLETKPRSYQFGEFTLDVEKGCVLKAGEELRLRPKVYETLKYLVEHPGRLIGKQELIQAVWPDTFVTDDSLVQCTVELRRALDDHGQKLLKTVPRRGYLFLAPVIKSASPTVDFAITDLPDLSAYGEPSSAKVAGESHGLPVPRTSLIGREQQVALAGQFLLRPGGRLLTLTGPGGAGKTRLAIAVAAAIADRFPAGVKFVGLASISNPDLVVTALAEAFGIRQLASRSVPKLIGDQLQNSAPFLLLLDNFEQVLPAATVVAETLEACPALKILVTSRAGLHIYGEQEFPVTSLAKNSAVELFVQRSAAVWPGFAITSENEPAIQEICSRLDGLPLAIELAAARTRALSPSAMLDRMQSRLRLLTGGALDLPERQQTIRNTIDWSHGLLSEAERKLFRRLSVFVGGCTLEAAEAVCNTNRDLGIDLYEGLSSLVDQNLVQHVDRAASEARFAMLEMIREYAFERLTESGEQFAVRRAHAAYYLVLAEEGNPDLSPGDRARWLAQCDVEVDNSRYALDWLSETQDLGWGLRFCTALFRFWEMREHLAEGRARMENVLRVAGKGYTKERARVSQFLGALVTTQGDFPAGVHYLEQGLSLYEELGDQRGIAACLNALAVSARDNGDYASARSNFERALACWRLLPDRLAIARCLHNLADVIKCGGDYARAQWALREATGIFQELGDRSGAAWSINQQGDIARDQGNLAEALACYRNALVVFRRVGDQFGSARSLTDLACIDCEQGNYLAAHAAYREALEIFAALGFRRGMARVLEGFACLALAQAQPARALKLASAAAHLRRQLSAPLRKAEQQKLDRTLLGAWELLGDLPGTDAWEEGAAMSLESAIEYSLENPESARSGP